MAELGSDPAVAEQVNLWLDIFTKFGSKAPSVSEWKELEEHLEQDAPSWVEILSAALWVWAGFAQP